MSVEQRGKREAPTVFRGQRDARNKDTFSPCAQQLTRARSSEATARFHPRTHIVNTTLDRQFAELAFEHNRVAGILHQPRCSYKFAT